MWYEKRSKFDQLTYSVDEIGGFEGPAPWHISVLNLDLFREDVVTDLLPGLANIGPLYAFKRPCDEFLK